MPARDFPCWKCGRIIASIDARGVYSTKDRIWTVSLSHERGIDGAVTVLEAEVLHMYCEACAETLNFQCINVREADCPERSGDSSPDSGLIDSGIAEKEVK